MTTTSRRRSSKRRRKSKSKKRSAPRRRSRGLRSTPNCSKAPKRALKHLRAGVPAPTVQWELSTDKGASWSLVGGATADTLKLPGVTAAQTGDEYRAVFTNASGKAETAPAALTVESIAAHEQKLAKQAQEAKAAQEAKERLEAQTREAEVARAKKLREEEVAKDKVLGVKESAPAATIASSSLQVSASGAVSIKINCPGGEASCVGTLTLQTLTAVAAENAGTAAKKKAILTLASGSFTVTGGGVKTVTLHLSAKARALLAHAHVLRARAMVVAHNPSGQTHSGQAVVTLRAARKKSKH